MRPRVHQKNPKVDTVMPKGKWEFDSQVAESFQNMLRRSIPQYDVMRKVVFDLARKYAKKNTAIVSLGCSRGDDLAPLVDHFGDMNTYVGVDVSGPMLRAAKKRFKHSISQGNVSIIECDLKRSYPPDRASVVLSILCVQFIPIEYRQRIIKNMYDSLVPGGAAIVVEKVLGESAELDKSFVELYLDMKKENGYTQEQIDRKKMSLEGVLVPVTAEWNEQLLSGAGFGSVDCFWRFLNFSGWVAIKT